MIMNGPIKRTEYFGRIPVHEDNDEQIFIMKDDVGHRVSGIDHEIIILADGRRFHWSYFFMSDTIFRDFLSTFAGFKCNIPRNFFIDFKTLLEQYKAHLDLTDGCYTFNIGGDVTEVKADKRVDPNRISEVILIREKFMV